MKKKETVTKATAKAVETKDVKAASVATPVKEVTKAEPVKAEVKLEAVKVEEKKPEVKEETKEPVKKVAAEPKKATPKKTAAKATTTKAKAVKEEKTTACNCFVQFGGNEVGIDVIQEKVKADYVAAGHKESGIKDLKIYIKPEDNRAYYVVNKKYSASVSLV